VQEHWDFSRENRNRDIDKQGNYRQTGQESLDEQGAAKDFKRAREARRKLWIRNSNFDEATSTGVGWEEKFLYAFAKEYSAHHDPDKDYGSRGFCAE